MQTATHAATHAAAAKAAAAAYNAVVQAAAAAVLNTVAQALYNTLQQLYPGNAITVDNDMHDGGFMGYDGCSVAAAQAAIPATLQALSAQDIDWGNLHTTTGYEDTTVKFTVAGKQHCIYTCYGA
jgi:hypothetical protein